MPIFKREEKKRLVAELIDELVSRPDPMEAYDRFMWIDFIVINGLMFGTMFALLTVRDILTGALLFCGVLSIIFGYTYFKSIKRQEAVMGKMFLDSTTYVADSDIQEQVEVEGWELLIAPAEHIDKDKLVYEQDDLLETLTALKSPGVRVGGGRIQAPIIDELARVKADKYIDEYKQREAEKAAPRAGFFKKKKPSSDLSKVEDERESIFEIIKDIDFEFLGDEDERED
jgi:xanthosine utilization system XapX-like protein